MAKAYGFANFTIGRRQRRAASGWQPPIILASAHAGRGVMEIDEAIDAHRSATLTMEWKLSLEVERSRYHIRALLEQRFDELLEEASVNSCEGDLATRFEYIARQMPLKYNEA